MQISLVQNKIYEIRGQKVMVDNDLAELYGVSTKVFNQAGKRNQARFPADFMFRLTTDEYAILRSQFVTSKRGGRRYLPYAFTEQGVAMLSGVINSERAIETNIVIMRTFVLLRQYSFSYRELQEKLLEMEKKYNKNFNEVFQAIKLLFEQKTLVQKESKRETIGFKTKPGNHNHQ